MSTQSIPLVDNTLEQINSKKKSTISQEIGSNSADMLDTISDPKAINASPTPQPKHMPSLSTGHTDSFGLQGSNVSLPPPPMNENMHPEDLSYTRKKLVFFLLVLLEAIVNFDSGAVAASLVELQDKYDMSKSEAGLTSSLVYVGLVCATLFAGGLLGKFNPQPVLICSLIANASFALMFALAPNTTVLLIARFFVGTTQAFLTIYGPVWVDEFAPADVCTTWMAFVQAGVPIGIVLGYITAGFMTANGLDVSISFFVQVAALVPLTIIFACVPNKFVDTNAQHKSHFTDSKSPSLDALGNVVSTEINNQPPPNNWARFKRNFTAVFFNPVYIMCTLGLCSLYFVVTGLQMWITEYLVVYMKLNKNVVVTAFSAVCATAPIAGVLAGGRMLDIWGGYKGPAGIVLATKTSTLLGVGAVVFALLFVLVDVFGVVIFSIWVLLFFGGAIVPLATGVIMTCVPRKLRSFAASFATMMYHLFGYFAGPTVIGGVADAYDGVQWGMRVCMSASGFGVVLFGLAWHFSVRQLKETRYLHGTKNMPQSDKKIVSMSNDKFDALSVTSDSTDTPHADDEISKQMMARSPSSPTLARHRNEKKFLDINVISAKNI